MINVPNLSRSRFALAHPRAAYAALTLTRSCGLRCAALALSAFANHTIKKQTKGKRTASKHRRKRARVMRSKCIRASRAISAHFPASAHTKKQPPLHSATPRATSTASPPRRAGFASFHFGTLRLRAATATCSAWRAASLCLRLFFVDGSALRLLKDTSKSQPRLSDSTTHRIYTPIRARLRALAPPTRHSLILSTSQNAVSAKKARLITARLFVRLNTIIPQSPNRIYTRRIGAGCPKERGQGRIVPALWLDRTQPLRADSITIRSLALPFTHASRVL